MHFERAVVIIDTMNQHLHHTARQPLRRLLPHLIAATPVIASCGDDACGPAAAAGNDDEVLAVVMDDFHYGGLPDVVPAGTRIEASNESADELHEFVAIRLADDERRPAAEIAAGDVGELLASTEPTAVLIVPPGGREQIAAVGDGTLTEPGRYLVVCLIPTGADPDEYLAAAATSDGPPQVDGGPPHIVNGMFAELTVSE